MQGASLLKALFHPSVQLVVCLGGFRFSDTFAGRLGLLASFRTRIVRFITLHNIRRDNSVR